MFLTNICDLDDYAVLSKVGDLSVRREKYIGGALEYACRFWTQHLAQVPGDRPRAQQVKEAIDEFFAKRLLCWIEVLIITGHLGGAVYAFNHIRKWYISVSYARVCSYMMCSHIGIRRESRLVNRPTMANV